MQGVNEKVLTSWLKMILSVDGEHLVSQLPYNEAVVCNLLLDNPEKQMTATDLCGITKMQKSLMNRTLTSLESKKLIERIRSNVDKRLVLVKLVNDVNNIFMEQHEKTLKYVDKIVNRIGKDKVDEVIALFDSITRIAQEEKK